MYNETSGRVIDFSAILTQAQQNAKPARSGECQRAGEALLLEPRTIRHQERVEDLFYLLFKRTGT